MITLDDLLHPITPAQFRAEYDGRKPLHIPAAAGSDKRALLPWDAFNGLLSQTGLWTHQNLRLMRNHVAVPPEQYCSVKQTPGGPVLRPWPPKVEVFLSAGASLVANDVLPLHPPIARLGAALGEAWAAEIGANIYCSFQGVRAFGTHYDMHDVFAVQTEGEKIWNLYETRADNPIDPVPDTMDTRREMERSRGRLMTAVHMKPGDVLYLPRGVYHDALTVDGPSLHVTYSINPLYGRILLSLLDHAAMQFPEFRAWLPPAFPDGGAALHERMKALGGLLTEIIASPAFRDEVAMAQRRLVVRPPAYTLPQRKPITLFRTTGRPFPAGSAGVQVAYDWMIDQRQFAVEDLLAQIDFLSEAALVAALAAAEGAGALQRG